jgi:hypothetical protein
MTGRLGAGSRSESKFAASVDVWTLADRHPTSPRPLAAASSAGPCVTGVAEGCAHHPGSLSDEPSGTRDPGGSSCRPNLRAFTHGRRNEQERIAAVDERARQSSARGPSRATADPPLLGYRLSRPVAWPTSRMAPTRGRMARPRRPSGPRGRRLAGRRGVATGCAARRRVSERTARPPVIGTTAQPHERSRDVLLKAADPRADTNHGARVCGPPLALGIDGRCNAPRRRQRQGNSQRTVSAWQESTSGPP